MAQSNIDAINQALSPTQIEALITKIEKQAAEHGATIKKDPNPKSDPRVADYNPDTKRCNLYMPAHLTGAAYLEALIHEFGHVLNNLQTPNQRTPNEALNPQAFGGREISAEAIAKKISEANGFERPNAEQYIKDKQTKYNITDPSTPKTMGDEAAQALAEGRNTYEEQKAFDKEQKRLEDEKEVDDAWQKLKDGTASVGDLSDNVKDAFNNFLPDWTKDWFDDVGNAFKNLFNNWGRNWFNLNRDGFANYRDPLTLDLDGDGIEVIGHNGTGGVMFDHTGEGIKNPTGWVHSDDGLLVYDRNGDGIINDGTELFGDSTQLSNGEKAAHGFAALADMDTNKDGVIDANDSAFSKLRVWRDLNGDGISQANELFTLNELGIASLNLEYQNVSVGLAGNNQLAQIGSYTKTDGSTGQMGDVNFNFDRLNNGFTDPIELTPEQEKAANVTGMGRLRDLREAATLSADLAAKLEAYTNAKTKEAQLALLPGLLEAWARTDPKFNSDYDKINFGVAEHDPNSSNQASGSPGGNGMTLISNELRERWKDATLLTAILDSFTNMTTERLAYISAADAERICNVVESTFAELFQANYDALLLQTRLKPYVDAISLTIKDGEIGLDFSPVLAKFEAAYALDAKNAFIDLGEFIATQQKNHVWVDGIRLFSHYIDLAKEQGIFAEFQAALGQHALTKMGYLFGTSSNDTLTGSSSNNILEGGTGNDLLKGGAGNDTYIFNQGDGHDTVQDSQGNNTLIFKDLKFTDARFMKNGAHLVIHGITGDSVTITNFFVDSSWQPRTYQFADQTFTREDFWKNGLPLSGNASNTEINGTNGWGGASIIYGGSGNETITTGAGNDYIYGGAGDDIIDAGAGDDIIEGGTGNDLLKGGAGNDTYIFNQGDGHDTVQDSQGNNTLIFKDLKFTDARFMKNGAHLVIHGITGDSVTITNFFVDSSWQPRTYQFVDQTLTLEDFKQSGLPLFGNANNATINGTNGWSGASIIYGGSGNETIITGPGNDIISGGAGNDQLNGGAGDDTYLFENNHGQDTITDSSGNDTIAFTGDQQAGNLWFSRQGNNLLIETLGTTDSITVNSWFIGTNNQIETIQLNNGQAIINQQVQALINAMASFKPAADSSIDIATQKQEYLSQIGITSFWEK